MISSDSKQLLDVLTPEQRKLLKDATRLYNEEMKRAYHAGELDFIPFKQTESDILTNALVYYIKANFPEEMEFIQ